MKVKKSEIPLKCLIQDYLPADYTDVYSCEVNFEKDITPDDIMVSFWTDFPTWVSVLFKLRHNIVKIVGLKSPEDNDIKLFEKCIRTGEAYSIVSIPAKSTNETVMLLTDKHLNAYMSIHLENKGNYKTISVITLVHLKNVFGRVYFFVIRPFHGLIAKSMLKRVVSRFCKKL